jgi:hypothetical protein
MRQVSEVSLSDHVRDLIMEHCQEAEDVFAWRKNVSPTLNPASPLVSCVIILAWKVETTHELKRPEDH